MAELDTPTRQKSASFLERKPLRRFLRKALHNWRERHRHPFNFAIHLLGIPIAVAGVVFLFIAPWWGLAGLVLGYVLQFIGHLVEGNDVGEWAAIKKMLGLPYVSIAPHRQSKPGSEHGN